MEEHMDRLDRQSNPAEIQQLIAERAYEIWENQGRPFGHHLQHWHQAEREILDCLAEDGCAEAIRTKLKGAPRAEAA
jgi:hypothetical protein